MNITLNAFETVNKTNVAYNNTKAKKSKPKTQNLNVEKNNYPYSKNASTALKNNISFGKSRFYYVENFHKKLNKPLPDTVRRLREFNILRNRRRLLRFLQFVNEQERIRMDNRSQIDYLRHNVAALNDPHLQENTQIIINTLNNEQSLSSLQTNIKLRLINKLLSFKAMGCDRISLTESFVNPEFINNNKFKIQNTDSTTGYTITVTPQTRENSSVIGVRFAQMNHNLGNVNSVYFNFIKYEGENNYVLDDFEISAKAGESLSNVYVRGDDNKMHNVENVNTLSFSELKAITEPDSYFINYLVAEPEKNNQIKIDNKTYWYALINNNLTFYNEEHANS